MIINSPYVSGSLTVSCNINVCGTINGTANICTSTLFASTRVCSPNLCATTTICGPAFIGGTVRGTTLYGSTVICGASICTTGNMCVAGNITGSAILSTGRITAQTLVVSTISSSVTFSSGSNIFGNNPANTQTMTGSLRVSGSSNHFILGCNVGIGITAPSSIFHVQSGNQISTPRGTGGTTKVFFSLSGSGTVGGQYFEIQGPATGDSSILFSKSSTDPNYGVLRYDHTSASLSLWASATQIVTVSGSGNVGIGTTAPSKKLDVITTVNSSTEFQLSLRNRQGSNSVSAGLGFGFNTVSADPDYLSSILSIVTNRTTRAADLTFSTAATGTLVERMRITSAGCVSIGTACTRSTLTIKSINDEGIVITRPSDAMSSHLKISTTETGGDAYTVKYNTFNNEMIFNTYAGGGTGGNIIFRTTCVGAGSESERLRINCHGIATFCCQVCVPRLQVFNTNSIIVVEGTATNGEGTVTIAGKNSSGTSREAIFKYDNTDVIRVATAAAIPMRFETNDIERMRITACGTVKTQTSQAIGALDQSGTIANNASTSVNMNSAGGNGSIGFIAIGAARTDTTACQAVRLYSHSHTNGANTYSSIQGTNDGGITISDCVGSGVQYIVNCSGNTVNYVVRYINLISLNAIYEKQ